MIKMVVFQGCLCAVQLSQSRACSVENNKYTIIRLITVLRLKKKDQLSSAVKYYERGLVSKLLAMGRTPTPNIYKQEKLLNMDAYC